MHVRGTHDPLVVGGDIHEQLVEIDILLIARADQVGKRVARNGKHGLTVALGVIQAVEQVNAARAGRRHANAEISGEFRVAACGEGGCLFVPHLHIFQLALVLSPGIENSVDPVPREGEHGIDSPIQKPFNEQIGNSGRHR